MDLLASLLPLLPLVAGAAALGFGWSRLTAMAAVLGSAGVLAGGIVLSVATVGGDVVGTGGGLIRVDPLSAFMLVVIGIAAVISTGYAVSYVGAELTHGHITPSTGRSYGVLVQVFIASMMIAVSTDNLGILWVAVEATTIATAFLVGQRQTRAAVEASWKYVVIASVGVSIAFLGTVLLYFTSRHIGGGEASLRWSELMGMVGGLDPEVTRLAAGLLVIGYGTKAGLAPLHTWLPDAHSQAPAPVSALMSGVLLSVSFYGLLRYKSVIDAVVGPHYMRTILVTLGLLSIGVAGSLLIVQRDYKRMLAYSSIEHMGLIAVGAAVGTPLAVGGALFHILGHAVGKSVAFCASGDILLDVGTTNVADVRAMLRRRPELGIVFGLALAALLGLPPFSMFASELAILKGAAAAGMGWVTAIVVGLMLVVFGALLRLGRNMLLGGSGTRAASSMGRSARVTLVGALTLSVILGVALGPLADLLEAAVKVVTP